MIRRVLKSPYPLTLYSLRKAIIIGLFITFFLFAFEPFGLQSIDLKNKIWISLGYGVLTFLSIGFNQFVLPKLVPAVFKEKRWTVLSQVSWLFWNIILITFFNYYYSIYVFDISNDSYIFLLFLFYTFLTALIPVTIVTIISHNRKLKKNLEQSSILNKELIHKISKPKPKGELILFASNRRDKVTISDVLFIESIGNYATVRWVENEKVLEKTIRNTLKDIEKQLINIDTIFRSHKAFIVNLDQIKEVDGNAQGYRLTLKNGNFQVPVSRNYIKLFNTKLGNL